MKLLIDENLSPKLPRLLAFQYPNSIHVEDVQLKSTPDELIWKYAYQHEYVILTRDADYLEIAQRIGNRAAGPKAIQLMIPNYPNRAIVAMLELERYRIERFEFSLSHVLVLRSPEFINRQG